MNDADFAAANLSHKPAIIEQLAPTLVSHRVAFLAHLEAIERAAAARKTLTDAELEEARVASRNQDHQIYSILNLQNGYATGALMICGVALRGSFRSGDEFNYLPLADAARRDVLDAVRALVASKEETDRLNVAGRALDKHSQWRRAAGTREKQAEARAAAAIPAGTYAIGDKVEVGAFGRWYRGEVVKIGKTGKVTVRYTTGTGATREKAVDADGVRA